MNKKRKIIVSLSGGMDSATVLAYFVSKGDIVHAISFYYGSKHNEYENELASKLCEHYGVQHDLIDISGVFKLSKSNLLKTGGDIPEGHYEQENMKLTVVPGRNLIFSSILAGIAESCNAEAIALGVHQGDHAIYPDCRKDFVDSLITTIRESTDGKVSVLTPFLSGDKREIIDWGLKNKVPYHLTRTCYKDQIKSCGKCGSCTERLEAFEHNKVEDPIDYE